MFETDRELFITVILGASLLTGLSILVVLILWSFKKRQQLHFSELETMQSIYAQQLLQSQIEVQEVAYRNIGKDLHDNVGQLLSTAKMLMNVTELKLVNPPDTLLTANSTIAKAIQELRMLSRSLDKEWLEQFNFIENLRTEIERINASDSIQADIECDTAIDMKSEEQIILFRIVQEAIQNALRHAQPSHIHVSVRMNQELEVKVFNDGNSLPANFHGMGTTNMQHRAQLFGGTVTWASMKKQTVVTICLPNKNEDENKSRIS